MQTTYKLAELIQTEYLYITTCRDLENLVEKAFNMLKGTPPKKMPNKLQEEYIEATKAFGVLPNIDLAGMHVTFDGAKSIHALACMGRVKFIDTLNPGREAVLEEDIRIYQRPHFVSTRLPDIGSARDSKDIQSYIGSLDSSIVYNIPTTDGTRFYALGMLTLTLRPKIQIVLSGSSGALFLQWVHKYLYPHLCDQFTEFYSVNTFNGINNAIVDIVHMNEHKDIETREKLTMDYYKAWDIFCLVPVNAFTKEALKNDSVFGALFRDVLQILRDYEKSKPVDLMELLLEVNTNG